MGALGIAGGRYARTVRRAVATILVSGGAWVAGAWPGPAPAAGASAGTGVLAMASAARASAARTSALTIKVSGLYRVSLPAGAWVPVAVSVLDRNLPLVQGDVVLRSASSSAPSGGGCMANGPTTFTCLGFGYTSPSSSQPLAPSGHKPATVTYRLPVTLVAGAAKRLVTYLRVGAGTTTVAAYFESGHGKVLATAQARLAAAGGITQPAVMVVTDDPSAVSSLATLTAPTGARAQVQYLAPAELPSVAAALGPFRAVAVDQADMSALSGAQARALESYVQAGGTLVVSGGIDWQETAAPLPASLRPGRPSGPVSSLRLPGLSRLLGAAPLSGKVDVAHLEPAPGSNATLSQGDKPLVLQSARGNGHVVLCAFDPASPPLVGWAGEGPLLERLFAPAYQSDYYATGLPYGDPGGVYPVAAGQLPPSMVGSFDAESNAGALLASPAWAVDDLSGYLGEVPPVTSPPSAVAIGLLLGAYVALVGPLCFFVLGRLKRRQLAWVVVPCLVALVVGVAGLTWDNTKRALLGEVRVSQLVPGGHVAEVTSLGLVQLPEGGSRTVELARASGPTLIGALPLGPPAGALAPPAGASAPVTSAGAQPGGLAGAQEGTPAGSGAERPAALTVSPGITPGRTGLTIAGPKGSAGGWLSSRQVRLGGTVTSRVFRSGGQLRGTVVNRLPVSLTDTQVVAASGEASQQLGTLGPGASATLDLTVQPYSSPTGEAFGALAPLPQASFPGRTVGAGSGPANGGTGTGASSSSPSSPTPAAALASARQLQLLETLAGLGAAYSAQEGGAPALVALAGAGLLPADETSAVRSAGEVDLVAVPLATGEPAQGALSGVPGALVGASGVTGDTSYALTTSSLTLTRNGSFDYEFLLPTGRWDQLVLDLGSSSGAVDGLQVSVSAYDYQSRTWEPLSATSSFGDTEAAVPNPSQYVAGGTLQVRLRAATNGVEVYGGFPTLSAAPLPGT
ncbi:MAG: hypothetical protein ACRDZX_03485 [Acidimicrobiales bacterium]